MVEVDAVHGDQEAGKPGHSETGVRGIHEISARVLPTPKGRLGLRREVEQEGPGPLGVGHRHRRHGVAQDVDLAREPGVALPRDQEQVVERVLDAVARRLARHDEGVDTQQLVDERLVA